MRVASQNLAVRRAAGLLVVPLPLTRTDVFQAPSINSKMPAASRLKLASAECSEASAASAHRRKPFPALLTRLVPLVSHCCGCGAAMLPKCMK
jgi:hypothetical protein